MGKRKKWELTLRNMKSTPRNKIPPHESLKEGTQGQLRLIMACVNEFECMGDKLWVLRIKILSGLGLIMQEMHKKIQHP